MLLLFDIQGMVIISAGCLLRSISFYTPVEVVNCWD